MATQIHIYTDYVCPYCLLAESVVNEALTGYDTEIVWHPFELRPDPIPTLRVEDPYLPRVWEQSVYPMARKLGEDIQLPSISPQPRTALAFQAFAFAEQHQLGSVFSTKVMDAFFKKNQDIGQLDVLINIANDIGLDCDNLRADLESGRHIESHREALRHATEDMAIKAVPTIVIGNMRHEGMPTTSMIQAAVEDLRTDNSTDLTPELNTHNGE